MPVIVLSSSADAPRFLFMHQACGALTIQIDDLPTLHYEDWKLK